MSNDDKEFVVIEDNDMPIDIYKKIDNKYKINGYVNIFFLINIIIMSSILIAVIILGR